MGSIYGYSRRYDIMRGRLGALPIGNGASGTCPANALSSSTQYNDPEIPPLGTGYYGDGTWFVWRTDACP